MKRFILYIQTSLVAAVVDIVLFYFILKEFEILNVYADIFLATVLARIGSSTVVYILNKHIVFKSEQKSKLQVVKHFLLVGSQMLLSGSLLTIVDRILQSNTVIEKCFVDVFLFLMSYFAQKYWVFKDDSH